MPLLYLYVYQHPTLDEEFVIYHFSQKLADRQMRKWFPDHEPEFLRREPW